MTSRLGDISTVATGIITAQFSRNVVGALEEVGRTSTQMAADFELATARIMAATGLTGEEAAQLRATLEDAATTLGVDFGTGATAAMEAMEALVKAGLEGEDATKALAGVLQLATIEGIHTADAANMVVAAMAQYGLTAEEATRIVDGFVKASAAGIDTATGYALGLSNVGSTASAMGFSLEETLAALVQIDASQKDAAKSGTFLNRALLNLVEKGAELGISLYNTDGSMKSLDEIIAQVRNTLIGFGDDQEAAATWISEFDTRAQRAILSLAGYDESVAETESRLGDLSSAQDQVNVILDTYSGQMSIVQAKQEEAAIGAGEVTTQISLMGAEMKAALGPIGLFAGALGPPLLQGTMQSLTTMAIPKIIGMIGGAGPLGLALAAGAVAVGVFAMAWQNNWFGIRDKTKAAIDAISGAFSGLTDWVGKLGKSWSNFWGRASKDVGDAASEITDAVEEIEFGTSPGGLRSAIAAAEDFKRAITGLGISGGGRSPVVIGPIYITAGDLGSKYGRGVAARDLAHQLGKEWAKQR